MIKVFEKSLVTKFLPIRIRIRHPEKFDKSLSYKSINLGSGIDALIGLQKGQDNLKIQTLLFNTDSSNGKIWSLRKAKKWLKENKLSIKSKIFLKDMIDFVKKPAPSLLTGEQLEKAVSKLKKHFQQLPRKINGGKK